MPPENLRYSRIQKMLWNGSTTERLEMHPFAQEDTQDMFLFTSNANTCKFLRWGPHKHAEEANKFIGRCLTKYVDPEDINWGIYLKETGRLIGAVHIYNINFENQCAEISYILNQSYTGKGYMTECISKVIVCCMRELCLKRIYANFVEGNRASERVMQRCGMVYDYQTTPWFTEIKGKNIKTYRYKIEARI
jgi:ribosomal-protein-alanine N-acetyltransferase